MKGDDEQSKERIPRYINYLHQALDTLFRNFRDNGFWDPTENRIIRALNCKVINGSLSWSEDKRILHRYEPFGLMGIAEWRASKLSDNRFDDKIRSSLGWYRDYIINDKMLHKIPSYGIGSLLYAYIKLANLLGDEEPITKLISHAVERFSFKHSEDALLLMGLSAAWHRLSSFEKDWVRRGIDIFSHCQRENGMFLLRTHGPSYEHQNQQYILWGLGEYGLNENSEKICVILKRNLEFTTQNRWREDGGILWWGKQNSLYRYGKGALAKKLLAYPISRELLYECHQTFFYNSAHYLRRLGINEFDRLAESAIEFIFGNNSLGINMLHLSGIGVPWRVITVDGRWRIKHQMFKGAYEIGSYVRALVSILEN